MVQSGVRLTAFASPAEIANGVFVSMESRTVPESSSASRLMRWTGGASSQAKGKTKGGRSTKPERRDRRWAFCAAGLVVWEFVNSSQTPSAAQNGAGRFTPLTGGRQIKIAASSKALTPFGGMASFIAWLQNSGFYARAARVMPFSYTSPRAFPVHHLFIAFIVSVVCWGLLVLLIVTGCALIRHFHAMLGFSRFPACDAILRFFGRFTQGAVEECFCPLFRWLLTLLSPPAGGFSLELDSTILQRKGSQEGALRGYNPRRPGRNSHHPLLAVLAEMPLVLHAWLRSGNTCSGRGVCAFLCEALALLPDSWRLRYVRADCLALPPGAHPCGAAPSPGCLAPLGCGFFDGALLDFHEKRAIPYIIVARMSTQIRRSLHSASLVWRDVDGTYSVSSFTEKLHGRKDTRRFVVVRARLREDKAAVGCKLIDVPGYTFSLWVTSRTDDAMHLWRDYNLRSAVFVCGALLGRAGRRLVLRLGQNTGGIEKHNPLIAKALDAGKAIAPLLPKRTHPPPLHHETDHPACLL